MTPAASTGGGFLMADPSRLEEALTRLLQQADAGTVAATDVPRLLMQEVLRLASPEQALQHALDVLRTTAAATSNHIIALDLADAIDHTRAALRCLPGRPSSDRSS